MDTSFQRDISIQIGSLCKQILRIGYSPKDGGYWIQDRVRPKGEKRMVDVTKLLWCQNNHGKRTTKATYQAFTSGDIKLSHHADGNAQVSGGGVLSGYDNGVPKGAAINSFSLNQSNDGGPVMTFSVWGIEHLPRDAREGDLILTPDKSRVHPNQNDDELNTIAIEGFYLLKHLLPKPPFSEETVNYHSDIAGHPVLHIVKSPSKTPGVLGFCASYVRSSNGADTGFFLSGAPGKVIDGYNEGLTIMYPKNGNSPLDIDLNWPR